MLCHDGFSQPRFNPRDGPWPSGLRDSPFSRVDTPGSLSRLLDGNKVVFDLGLEGRTPRWETIGWTCSQTVIG